jgi:phospholipase C
VEFRSWKGIATVTTYEGTMQNGAKRRHKDVVLAASSALALALSVEMSVAADPEPKTPIRHIVVIYDENISFLVAQGKMLA